jgi:hypothetical protein
VVGAILETGTARGDLAYQMRNELGSRPLYMTAGRGLAMPNAGALGPMRGSGYGVTTDAEARARNSHLPRGGSNKSVWGPDDQRDPSRSSGRAPMIFAPES